MELITKAILLSLVAGLFGAAMQKSVPAVAMLLGLLAAVLILQLAMNVLAPVLQFLHRLQTLSAVSGIYAGPLLKCLGIAVLERVGVSFCRDAGQSSAAAAIELCAVSAALYAALPLLEEFLSMIGELL